MGNPELGTKCTCDVCNERFYDLNRPLATCPKCGARRHRDDLRGRRSFSHAIETRQPDRRPEEVTGDTDLEIANSSAAADCEDASDAENENDAEIEIESERDAAA